MNPVAEDIKDKLVEAEIGVYAATTGWGIFTVREPDEPVTAITVYSTSGPSPGYYSDKPPLHYSYFQVRVRALSDSEAWIKMEEVIDLLDRIGHFDIIVSPSETIHYVNLLQTMEPVSLQVDDKQHYRWVANFLAYRKKKREE